MDVDELRRSQRRYKKTSMRSNEVLTTPSQEESDDLDLEDEDEVSTPSAEAADRNIMSMLSMRLVNSFCQYESGNSLKFHLQYNFSPVI